MLIEELSSQKELPPSQIIEGVLVDLKRRGSWLTTVPLEVSEEVGPMAVAWNRGVVCN